MDIDTTSATWRALEEHLKQRLAAARVRNETVGLEQAVRDATCGEINVLKDLLSLPARAATLAVASQQLETGPWS